MSTDPLDMPQGEVDVSFARLKEGAYRMIIRSPEVRENDEGTKMITFKLETTEEAMSTNDQVLHVGFKFTHRLTGVTGKREAGAVAKDCAILARAVGLAPTVTARQMFENPGMLADKLVNVKVGIDKARTDPKTGREYGESNRVNTFIPA